MAFQIECKCGKKLTLHNKMKGKKFNCPHCKLVISLKTKSAASKEPARKQENSAAPLIALKDESGEFPVPIPERNRLQRKPPSKKNTVFDEVVVLDDSDPVMLEIDVDTFDDDDYGMPPTPPIPPTPSMEPAYLPTPRSTHREDTNIGKTLVLAGLVALGIAFIGFVGWQIYVNLPEIDMSLAEDDDDELNRRLANDFEQERRRRGIFPGEESPKKTPEDLRKQREDFEKRMADRRRERVQEQRRRRISWQERMEQIDLEFERNLEESRRKREEEEARNVENIKKAFAEYQRAVETHNGKKVASLLSEESLATFGKFRKHALNSDMRTVKKLGMMEQTMVLALRVRFTADELESLSRKDFCVQYFSRGPVELLNQGYKGLTLGELIVLNDEAIAHENRMKNRKYPPSVYFIPEGEGEEWKVDLFNRSAGNGFLRSEYYSASSITRSGMSQEEYIVEAVKANVKNRLTEDIWKPIKSSRRKTR